MLPVEAEYMQQTAFENDWDAPAYRRKVEGRPYNGFGMDSREAMKKR